MAFYLGDTVSVNCWMDDMEADACKTGPVGMANACGTHVHAGNTCEDAAAVGGHYFDATSITADPWAPINYTNMNGVSKFMSKWRLVRVRTSLAEPWSCITALVHV